MNHLQDFGSHMAANGLACSDRVIDDGALHRYWVDGDKRGSRNGWYVVHGDALPCGFYGSWRAGNTIRWFANSTDRLISPWERERLRRLQQSARRKRLQEEGVCQQVAADKARSLWARGLPADVNHPYLQTKKVPPYDLRQIGSRLSVPLYAAGELINLQRIAATGQKRFQSGARLTGCYTTIGQLTARLYVCEGWATGATIHRLTGCGVLCAMTAGNLTPVAQYVRGRYPDLPLVIAADNDHLTEGNPGLTLGLQAAEAVRGLLIWPRFAEGSLGTDFNDLAVMGEGVT
jgi:putative DNA primase/helicase